MKFLTFLNSGCIAICKNMLISAEKVGLNPDDFIIACLDENAFTEFSSYKNAYLAMNHPIKTYANWSYDENSEFRTIIKHKWTLIAEHYNNYKNLCYLDTDIVFTNNPLPYIENNNKMLFQRAYGPQDESLITNGSLIGSICSGFMVFNETAKCTELIKKCITSEYSDDDDQLLINEIAFSDEFRDSCNFLPVVKFPLAKDHHLFNDIGMHSAVLHHCATLLGIENKINYLKNNNVWYI